MNVNGTSGDDVLVGGPKNDKLFGGNGNDTLLGGAGNDFLDGGCGNDWLVYNTSENLENGCGSDIYYGGWGYDTLVLELTSSQAGSDSVQQDIDDFKAFLARGCGWFEFSSFDLRVARFEKLEVVILDSGGTPPVAVNDSNSTDEENAASGNVLDNDTDADAGDTLSVSAVNGQSGNVGTAVALLSGALLTVNADGSFTYNPNGKFESLGVGQTASDSFSYVASDSQGLSDAALVTITVNGVNDAPVATDDANTSDEDSALLVSAADGLLDNDTDVDSGDARLVASVNGQAANVGTQITLASGALLTVNADGSYTYDPNDQFEFLDAGQSATDSFTYVASDSQGASSNTATATITITGVNDAPVAVSDTNTTDEDTPVMSGMLTSLLGNDTDVDQGDMLTVASVNGQAANVGTQITLASGALLTVNADGSYTYDPNDQFEFLDAGQSATDSFTYVTSDSLGESSNEATVTITITGVDDAPEALHVAVIGVIRLDPTLPSSMRTSAAIAETAAQLNDSSVFSIDADAIPLSTYLTEEAWSNALAEYDVVVVGSSGVFNAPEFNTSPLFPALRDFVDAGGGVVTTGWFAYDLNNMSVTPAADADYISPVAWVGTGGFTYATSGTTITVLDSGHPITHGVPGYVVDAAYHEQATAIDTTATRLAWGPNAQGTSTSSAIAYDEVGNGRTAYLGGLYLADPDPDRSYDTAPLRDPWQPGIPGGTSDQLLEQAVVWAGGGIKGTQASGTSDPADFDSGSLADAGGAGGMQLTDFAADLIL
jgi:VCBS repeat-containing protein